MQYTHSYMIRSLALAALALLATAAPAAAQSGASGGSAGGRCRTCDSVRAESWARYGPELARLRTQVALMRAEMMSLASRPSREADSALAVLEPRWRQVATRLVQLEADMDRDAARRALDGRTYRQLSTISDSLQKRVRVRLVEPMNAPQGYMGVVVTGSSRDRDVWTKQYLAYPVVRSVDPGSPAARAGIQSGDTVLAYDGADVRKSPVQLHKLLRPGETVRVRVKRAGRVLDLPVVIARRHEQPARVLMELGEPEAVVVPRAPRPARAPVAEWNVRMPASSAGAATPQSAPSVGYVYVIGDPPPNQLIAGAEIVRVSPDLGEPFGVEVGLLVLSVAPNTPAAQAGLRPGDVIVRVDGQEVALPIALRRALERAEGNALNLEIVRKKKKATLKLTW